MEKRQAEGILPSPPPEGVLLFVLHLEEAFAFCQSVRSALSAIDPRFDWLAVQETSLILCTLIGSYRNLVPAISASDLFGIFRCA